MSRVLFAATLFVSAFLLFLVQPMVAKMVLPVLGGTPAVWITCMVFFQAALLAGYLYAHGTATWVPVRVQTTAHVALLAAGLAALPLLTIPLRAARGDGADAPLVGSPPTASNPAFWLLGLLTVSVGVPFFLVSTSAPLLQRWYSGTNEPDAHDPYFLYGASNLGSLLALLGYPIALEPFLALGRQAWLWTAGYGLLVALTAGCAWRRWRTGAAAAPPEPAPAKPGQKTAAVPPETISWLRRLRWVALAFVPSSLLLGVTTFLSTDIAAIPLLWVVPLALYLLTFILVFAARPRVPPRLTALLLPLLIVFQFLLIISRAVPVGVSVLVHLAAFFVAAMVCHAQLAADRPSAARLTEFYLWMSLGGVLGGLFNALIAPALFNMVAEYPLELGLACLCGPAVAWARGPRLDRILRWGVPLAGGLLTPLLMVGLLDPAADAGSQVMLLMGPAVLIYVVICRFTDRPLLFGLGVACALLVGLAGTGVSGLVIDRERDFFGVLRVAIDPTQMYTELYHGTTLHGRQNRQGPDRDTPLTYYHPSGPIGQVFDELKRRGKREPVGVIGLGTGSLAYYGQPHQEMVFYEIEPGVKRIATDPAYFTFIRDSSARVEIVLGDGRQSLARERRGKFGLLVLDAFSSDAIPVHLLTREALKEVYLPHLTDNGLLTFHLSNRFMDLAPVVGALARDAGLTALVEVDSGNPQVGKTPSTWVVMAGDREKLGKLSSDPRWRPLSAGPNTPLWTDEFSNVVRVFRWFTPPAAQQGRDKPSASRPGGTP